MTAFSVVVASWNSADDLRALLATARHLDGHAHEWVVVDNGSADDSCAVVRELAPQAQIVETGRNLGFARANNLGVRAARHPVCVLLNPDCLLLDGSLARLADAAARERALVGPRILNPDMTWQSSAHAPLASWHAIASTVVPAAIAPRAARGRLEPWRVDERRRVGWLTAACLAAPTDVLRALGPFEERLHMFGEDADLALRAAAAGIPSIFDPHAAAVVHVGGSATHRRYRDSGLAAKIGTRRWVVGERLGRRRLILDDVTQTALHATRLTAKRALGREADYERAYLALMRQKTEITAAVGAAQNQGGSS